MKAYTPLSSRVTALLHAFVPLLNEFQQARHVRARAVPAGCRRPPRAPMGASFDTTAARGGLEEASEGHSHVLTQSVPCSRTGERDGLLDGSKPSEMLHEMEMLPLIEKGRHRWSQARTHVANASVFQPPR